MTPHFFVRQGDVLVVRVAALPSRITPKARDAGRVILAYGEVTGHCHQVVGTHVLHYDAPDAATAAMALLRDAGYPMTLTEANAPTFLDIADPATVEHDEHTAHTLPAGRYVALRQVQWSDAQEPIQVQD
jgi:hypothetical protein